MKTNEKLIDEYLSFRRVSNTTKKQYRSLLNGFNRYIDGKEFKSIDEGVINKYLNSYKSSTRNQKLATLCSFYRFLYDMTKKQTPPQFVRIEYDRPNMDEVAYRERLVSEKEYSRMIANVKGPQKRAMLETFYLFGVRESELLSIKYRDVSYYDGITQITVRESKTKTRDVVYRGRAQYLLEYVETYFPYSDNPDHLLFYSEYDGKDTNRAYNPNTLIKYIKRLSKRTIQRRVKPHDFRHTAVSRARAEGWPQTHIESQFGFTKGTRMMAVYDHNGADSLKSYLKEKDNSFDETYEELKTKKTTLEEKQEKEIKDLKMMVEALGLLKKYNSIYRFDSSVSFYVRMSTTDPTAPEYLDKNKHPMYPKDDLNRKKV